MAQQVGQDERGETQTRARGFHVPDRPFQVGDVLPFVCGVSHVAWVLGISESGVHQLRQRGKLREFLLPSLGDRKARYCGKRLMQWAAGEFAPERSFGRRRVVHGSQATARQSGVSASDAVAKGQR